MLTHVPGGHDNGYLPTLTALQNEHLLHKLVLIKGYNEIAKELESLKLPVLNLEVIFRPIKLPQSPHPVKSPLLKPVILADNALQLTYGNLTDVSRSLTGLNQGEGPGLIHSALANASAIRSQPTVISKESNNSDKSQSPRTPTRKLNEKQVRKFH